jgi:hypothetical protein
MGTLPPRLHPGPELAEGGGMSEQETASDFILLLHHQYVIARLRLPNSEAEIEVDRIQREIFAQSKKLAEEYNTLRSQLTASAQEVGRLKRMLELLPKQDLWECPDCGQYAKKSCICPGCGLNHPMQSKKRQPNDAEAKP